MGGALRTALFLQCRLDSSRLPGKALKPLMGKPVIVRVMEALKKVPAREHVLLTTEDSKMKLQPWAEHCGFTLYTGPKNDVLHRFLMAADHFNVSTIIRATGDNPLVSPTLATSILEEHIKEEAHYSGYLGIPLGVGVEILNTDALKKAFLSSKDPYDREHVSPYLYNNPQQFKIHRPDISDRYGCSSVKVSIDTQEDYQRMEKIFKHCYQDQPIEIDSLLSYIRENNLK